MSFDMLPSGAIPQEPTPHAAHVRGEARTLTLRLRSTGTMANAGMLEGSVLVPVVHPAMPHTLHAGVVRADAAPLTLTFQRV